MGYVIAAVLVLLLVGGFVTYLVLNATRKSGPAAGAREESPGVGRDETPLGDTTEHAGEQTEAGTTARDPEQAGFERDDPSQAAHVGRPGEGEGRERLEFEDEPPRSERLANRDDPT